MNTGTWHTSSKPSDNQGLVIEDGTGRNVAVTYDPKDAPLAAKAHEMLAILKELLQWIHDADEPRPQLTIRQADNLVHDIEHYHELKGNMNIEIVIGSGNRKPLVKKDKQSGKWVCIAEVKQFSDLSRAAWVRTFPAGAVLPQDAKGFLVNHKGNLVQG